MTSLSEINRLQLARDIAQRELADCRAEIAKLRHERDGARAIARVLAHSYEHDSRPPVEVVRDALAFPLYPVMP